MRTENLAIVFIDIAGFTPRTSAQTREENLRMLQRFDGVVRPIARAYDGRVVKTIGDAYLLTFRSPTNALLCSMAIHDRIAETDGSVDPADRFLVRAAVNAGDVRVEGGDVFGEAVNIASRIEGRAAAGEIYFSESVFLSMTRSEVPSEEVGYAELKGIAGKVRLYRVPRAGESGYALKKEAASPGMNGADTGNPPGAAALPFGGHGLYRVRDLLGKGVPAQMLEPAMGQARKGAAVLLTIAGHLFALAVQGYDWWRVEMRRSRVVQYTTIAVIVAVIALVYWLNKRQTATPWQRFQRQLGL